MSKLFLISLSVITLLGLYFRLSGIHSNFSFWTDESNVTLYSRAIIETGLPILSNGYTTGIYQIALQYLVAIFFSLFGISEFSARLPFVLFGSASIFLGGLFAKKLTNSVFAGVYAAFLLAFIQIELSYSTQVRPYIVIQFISFILGYLIINHKGWKMWITGGVIGIVAVLFHLSAALLVIAWGAYVISLLVIKKGSTSKRVGLLFTVGVLLILLIGFIQIFSIVKISYFDFLHPKNNISHLNLFFLKTYWFLSLPAIIGMLFLFKKQKHLILFFVVWTIPLIFLWTFYSYVHNIRYLVPVIGWLIIFSAVGINALFMRFKLSGWLFIICIIAIFFLSKDKLMLVPKNYYTPNNDFYGDVQNADYKNVYKKLDTMYGSNLHSIAIFDSWNDRTLWYLRRSPSALFLQKEMIMSDGRIDPMTNAPIYTNVEQFKTEQAKYPEGLVFIEEWQSPMSDEVEQYVIKNLKFEFRNEGFSIDPKDRWPVSIYSWGL